MSADIPTFTFDSDIADLLGLGNPTDKTDFGSDATIDDGDDCTLVGAESVQQAPVVAYAGYKTGEEDEERVGQWITQWYSSPPLTVSGDQKANAVGDLDQKSRLARERAEPEAGAWKNMGVGTLRMLVHKETGVARLVFRDRFLKRVHLNRTIHPQDKWLNDDLDGSVIDEVADFQRDNIEAGCMVTSFSDPTTSERIAWVFETPSDKPTFRLLWKKHHVQNKTYFRQKLQSQLTAAAAAAATENTTPSSSASSNTAASASDASDASAALAPNPTVAVAS